MKSTVLKITLIVLGGCLTGGSVFGQYAGRKFISGDAGIYFSSFKDDDTDVGLTRGGVSLAASLGRFTADNKAKGFLVKGGVGFDRYLPDTPSNTFEDSRRNGINDYSFGTGMFWNYYKHFSSRIGIYGGPAVSLGYVYEQRYMVEFGGDLVRRRNNTVNASLSLTGGAYYQFSPKWWLTISLAYSDPVTGSFTHGRNTGYDASSEGFVKRSSDRRDNIFAYRFTPQLYLPSVGVGLTYFLK